MSDKSIERYDRAAGGWDALAATAAVVREQGAPATSSRALLKANQPSGFDCPGCAWPDPKHTSSFEFCENGAKAVAWETTSRTVGPEFFAAHTVTTLLAQSDHWLESQGRLTHPLKYDAASDRYVPVSWADAAELVALHLRALSTPDAAAFYTSGRTSNEAAFLYQLFAREYGTNNMPDCSNLCHEASSVGLPQSIGVGKGTVQLADFDCTDLILSFGHNPGTNHPRMLTTLRAARKRGVPLLVFNPLRERGLERFVAPHSAVEMLTGEGTELATQYLQLRVGSDALALQGLMKLLLEWERGRSAADAPIIDREFIDAHTTGFDELTGQLDALSWDEIVERTGVTRAELEAAARQYARAPSTIVAYGMGITQHAHGTENVQQIANLLLLRGNIGRPGAGICPVRGHSNVQGDRTMGINERPPADFLDRIEATFGFSPPRTEGYSVVECIEAMRDGRVRVLVALGGNMAVAAPDPVATAEGMSKLALYVGIHTKLNRSHLLHRGDALILPALARSDLDVQETGVQSVTVEDSMSMVHASHGFKAPPSPEVRSEPAIVGMLAAATLPNSKVDWDGLVQNYDRVRDLVEKIVPGFENYNERIRIPGGFHLPNAAATRTWKTQSGKARFKLRTTTRRAADTLPLVLTTIRSHDQYNTTIYGLNDRYRGIKGRRDVVFMNEEDMRARGIETGEAVTVRAANRVATGFHAVAYPIARGSCAAYFPEASVLVALEDFDPQSRTPAYKSTPVEVVRVG
ncbi:molybdopterin-dependent oxidoreductase alpha subunit [Povalibacter uvarum]|uniref:Molybdopterin-dependent oxidoreductase alpha subunit n=1 Tax=Povalibacter uvarum TaxID=732238 RepID=A0A841HLB8_9GAMM|nr:FdhF/YdeP family oxidoreductase [Povalibacter uvarum]MBB6093867.1 molybdopterin-dependent oxidoreductase alpha subunit [Povalibacter uvarum]